MSKNKSTKTSTVILSAIVLFVICAGIFVFNTFQKTMNNPNSKKEAYDAISDAVYQQKEDVILLQYALTEKDVHEIIEEINLNPDFFYLNKSSNLSMFSKYVYKFGIKYDYAPARVQKMKQEIDDALSVIYAEIPGDNNPAETARLVHDYLINHCEYDKHAEEIYDKETAASYTAYGVLINGKGVCSGYSMAYKLILENVYDIDCILVTNTKEGHMWNAVKIDDAYYHVDITWDGLSRKNGASENAPLHLFFLLSDDAIDKVDKTYCRPDLQIHNNWDDTTLKCNSTKFDAHEWPDE